MALQIAILKWLSEFRFVDAIAKEGTNYEGKVDVTVYTPSAPLSTTKNITLEVQGALPMRGEEERIRRAFSSRVLAGRFTECETVPYAFLTDDGHNPANRKDRTAKEMIHRASRLERRGRDASSSMLLRAALSEGTAGCLTTSSSSSPGRGL